MDIDTSGIAMFVHVALVVVGLMMAAVLHFGLIQLWRSTNTAEMRPWAPTIRHIEPILPVVALAILASGAWLIHLSGGEFTWGDAWIYMSLAGLVIAEGVGGLLAPASHDLTAAVTEAPKEPVSDDLRRRARNPALWYGAHFVTSQFFGIIFLMSAKPSSPWMALVVLVVAAAVGLTSAVPFAQKSQPKPVVASSPEHEAARQGR
jgi:hypothetical protein